MLSERQCHGEAKGLEHERATEEGEEQGDGEPNPSEEVEHPHQRGLGVHQAFGLRALAAR